MPRWKTPRWTLGAPALVALAVAGCGAAASQPKLHRTSEKRLLSLVARARTDASNHNGSAVHADLGEFVSDVETLTTSGQLSRTTAGRLDREARATAAQAAVQLHQKPATQGTTIATATSATASSATQPADPTPSAGHPAPPVKNTPPPPNQKPPTHNRAKQKPPKQNDQGHQGDGTDGPTWPDPGHQHGHGHADWSSSQSGAYETSVAKAWAKWWKRVTGGAGD